MRSSLVLVALVLGLSACTDSICTRNSDCAHGLVCGEADTCVVPPDMTTLDLSAVDASADLTTSIDASGVD